MPLRIAFDLDGVLADMDSELVRQAEMLFSERELHRLHEHFDAPPPRPDATPAAESSVPGGSAEPPASDAQSLADTPSPKVPPLLKLHLTARQQVKLWRHVESIEGFWESLYELEPGVIKRLATIASERKWEIIFVTKRPESAGATAQVQTQRWLEAKGFKLPSVFVVQGSRGRIAAALALDFVIDDRPENCLDVVTDSRARAILVWRGDERLLPPAARRMGIGVVKSVAECLDILVQVDAPPQERRGVVNRVMRLLGLKETANVQ